MTHQCLDLTAIPVAEGIRGISIPSPSGWNVNQSQVICEHFVRLPLLFAGIQ